MEPRLAWGERTYLMGIVNVTPDSFSGDGLATPKRSIDEVVAAAVEQATGFVAAGAEIVDVGAESTRPRSAYGDRPAGRRRGGGRPRDPGGPRRCRRAGRSGHRQHRHDEGNGGAGRAGRRRADGQRRVGRDARPGHGRRGGRGRCASRADAQPGGVRLRGRRLRDRRRLAADGGRDGRRARGRARADHRRPGHRLREGNRGEPRAAPSAGGAEGGARRDAAAGRHQPQAVPRRAARRCARRRTGSMATAATVALAIAAGADIVRVHDVEQMARIRRVADAIVRR